MSINTGKRGAVVISTYQFEGITSAKWGDNIPNLAEFEIAILDMTSIGSVTYKIGYVHRRAGTINGKVSKPLINTLKRINNELRILLKNGGEVYFILERNSFMGWYRFTPKRIESYGETIKTYNSRFDPYLEHVKPWKFLITDINEDNVLEIISHKGKSLAENTYGGIIALSFQKNFFLPSPANKSVEEGIHILLQDVLGIREKATKPPSWINDFKLPGEKERLKKLNNLENEIKSLKSEISELNKIKVILYETGDYHLVNGVVFAFRKLGFPIKNITDRKEADIEIKTKKGITILGEVKGTNKTLARHHLRQLTDWLGKFWTEHENEHEPKGLMIINPFRLKHPNKRKNYYPNDCLKYAYTNNICIMTTMDLFDLIEKHLEGELNIGNLESLILNTKGEFELK